MERLTGCAWTYASESIETKQRRGGIPRIRKSFTELDLIVHQYTNMESIWDKAALPKLTGPNYK
jgi:hypothetical protein